MAIELSSTAELLLQKRNLEPNLILEIEGINNIYGAITIFQLATLDSGLYFDSGVFLDEPYAENPNSKSYVSLGSSGSTINQQLLQDKGGTQSISTFRVELIDKNQEITRLITPGQVLDEILGVRAKCYVNYGGAHPEDSILFHRGIISNIESNPASISFVIDSPERLKHQEIFIKQTTKLNGALNNSATTITVDSTANYLSAADALTTYIQIEDEIIQYTGKTATTFTGCVRGSLGTTAVSHDDNTEVSSLYRLQDDAVSLALKIMMSQAEEISDIQPREFDASGNIYFSDHNIQTTYGLVVGDKITTTGAINPANNLTLQEITGFGTDVSGSFIETNAATVYEPNTTAIASFKSKYDVLSDGLAMQSVDVDVDRHEQILERFSNAIRDYDFRLKDTIKPNEFLNEQIYFPSSLYSLPRKAKASVGIMVPPIADDEIVYLDEQNIVKASSIKSSRSTNKNFYNAVVFKYEKNVLTDKYDFGSIHYSADSQNRIKNVGTKPLTIESDGTRDNDSTDVLNNTIQRRLLDRYQFAAESYPGIQIFGKTGIALEIGDVIVFGSSALNLSDTTTGNRNFQPKLYEVVNKSLNIKTQEVRVDLLSTNFELDGRYGVVSPSSLVDTGSTTTNIVIKDSFSTVAPNIEQDKWTAYIGETILIHSPDWSYSETTVLTGFDESNAYIMQVSPALSSPPSADYIIDAPMYDTGTNPEVQAIWKLVHCFFDPQVPVVSGISTTQFTVSAPNASKFHVGSIVMVHDLSFSNESPEVEVTDITGTTITVDSSLGFTPTSSMYVELIGFPDEGLPYRLI